MMREQALWFIAKILISGVIIAYTSWLAGRSPVFAGFIVAIPFVSLLSILFSYLEYRDMEKVNRFAVSILVAIPLTLSFFLPFFLNKWLKMSFPVTFAAAMGLLALAYWLQSQFMKF